MRYNNNVMNKKLYEIKNPYHQYKLFSKKHLKISYINCINFNIVQPLGGSSAWIRSHISSDTVVSCK